jgi:hypothetical protein
LTWSISDFYDQLILWLKHRIRWIAILIFIVRSNVRSSTILCHISHNCIRSKRDFLKRMLQNEVHHSFSSETRLLRIRSLKNHSLCKFAFLSRNASKSMLRLLFFLIIQTRVCRSHFMWRECSCELIWLTIWRFSRNFLWIVYKNYKIKKIFVSVWDFETLLNEE